MEGARKTILREILDAKGCLEQAVRTLDEKTRDIHTAERHIQKAHGHIRKSFMAYDSAVQSQLAKEQGRA